MHTSHLGFVLAEDTAWKNKLDFVFFTKQWYDGQTSEKAMQQATCQNCRAPWSHLHSVSVTGQSHFLIMLHVSRPQARHMHVQFNASATLSISKM